VLGWGIEAMVWCARRVAALPGAVTRIPAIPAASFALMVAGGLWLLLWRTRLRLCGLAAMAAGIALAPWEPRPDVLVGPDGQLVAVRGADGRLAALPAPHSAFELARWLEHDGDARPPQEAARAAGFRCDAAGCTVEVRGATVAVARHAAAVRDDCQRAGILVLPLPRPAGCARPRLVLDIFTLRAAGTHAIYVTPGADLRVETVAAERGNRPWSRPRARRAGPRSTAVAATIAPESARASAAPRAERARRSSTATQDLERARGSSPAPQAEFARGTAQALERPEIEDDDETRGEASASAAPQDGAARTPPSADAAATAPPDAPAPARRMP
jgi:competence protein ComEC